MIHAALAAAGVPDFTITLNNRKILDGFLQSLELSGRSGPVLRAIDKLAKIGRDAVVAGARSEPTKPAVPVFPETRPLSVLDFIEAGRGGVEVLERSPARGCKAARRPGGHRESSAWCSTFSTAAGVPRGRVAIDLGLARGLDYYTGIVFETTINGWEKFGSVASGGRYDNLASLFTPRKLPGVGASIGLDRLLALLEEAGKLGSGARDDSGAGRNFPGHKPEPLRLGWRPGFAPRASGPRSIPTRYRSASRWDMARPRGHKLAVIVGPDEEAKQVFNLRNLATRQEDKGLAWSVLEDSVQSVLEIIRHEGAGS